MTDPETLKQVTETFARILRESLMETVCNGILEESDLTDKREDPSKSTERTTCNVRCRDCKTV